MYNNIVFKDEKQKLVRLLQKKLEETNLSLEKTRLFYASFYESFSRCFWLQYIEWWFSQLLSRHPLISLSWAILLFLFYPTVEAKVVKRLFFLRANFTVFCLFFVFDLLLKNFLNHSFFLVFDFKTVFLAVLKMAFWPITSPFLLFSHSCS